MVLGRDRGVGCQREAGAGLMVDPRAVACKEAIRETPAPGTASGSHPGAAPSQEQMLLLVPSESPSNGQGFRAVSPSDRAVLCLGHLVKGAPMRFPPIKYRDRRAASSVLVHPEAQR